MIKKSNFISIIIPCYNVEKYVERCINSIKNQTINNFEVLLIDDGSKDNTKNIINKLIKEDSRFKYFYKENGGQASARNYGLDIANGDFIAFIDSDDWVESNYLEELYNAITTKNVDIAICNIKRVYKDYFSINEVNEFNTNNCIYPAPWNKMFKKNVFKNIRFPIGKLYEDLNAISKIILTFNYTIVNKELYNYAINEGSTMHIYDKRIYDIFPIVEDIESYAKEVKIYDDVYSNLEFINIYHILIGTIYRASFMDNFSIKDIKKISSYIRTKYPMWYRNNNLINLNLFYRTYLKCLRYNLNFIIFIMLKLFNKKVHL